MKTSDVVRGWVLGGLLGALGVLAGCGADKEPAQAPVVMTAVDAGADLNAEAAVLELWSHSCALCHVDGNGGAPRVGNETEWAPRLAQGADVLLQHTLEGFNQMPPLGYCMACERSDFVAMIDFMTQNMSLNQVQGEAP